MERLGILCRLVQVSVPQNLKNRNNLQIQLWLWGPTGIELTRNVVEKPCKWDFFFRFEPSWIFGCYAVAETVLKLTRIQSLILLTTWLSKPNWRVKQKKIRVGIPTLRPAFPGHQPNVTFRTKTNERTIVIALETKPSRATQQDGRIKRQFSTLKASGNSFKIDWRKTEPRLCLRNENRPSIVPR